jgi:CubicO group peptidase (beta-lactamase class C family)
VLWGSAPLAVTPLDASRAASARAAAVAELAARLPAKPLDDLRARLPDGTLDGFGGPVLPRYQVARALVRDGTLYYEAEPTAYGDYPYPLEMRFGVRSVMKSVAAPLSLLRLAQLYGADVLEHRIGDYVPGLDPKWRQVRFIDAANMATGFGGTGTLETRPNDILDGYLEADYDGWYTAPSAVDKLQHMNSHLRPYPWAPGTVVRYRDQDYFLLGLAVDAFLRSKRGPDADAWNMLRSEVFEPIGIAQAPTVRTREAGGRDGFAWFNAGYYPTLDDLAKIALLYQDAGQYAGRQILHRELTEDLLAARGALDKFGENPPTAPRPGSLPSSLYYRMGFHFTPYTGSRSGQRLQLPTMSGFGDNEVILFPGRIVAIRAANVANVAPGEKAQTDDADATLRAVDRMAPF